MLYHGRCIKINSILDFVSILPIGRKGCENPKIILIRFNSLLVFTRNTLCPYTGSSPPWNFKNHWQIFTLSGMNDDNSQNGSQPKNVGTRQLLRRWFMQNGLNLNRLPLHQLKVLHTVYKSLTMVKNRLINWHFDVKTHLPFTAFQIIQNI
jgi:hypothetical protein